MSDRISRVSAAVEKFSIVVSITMEKPALIIKNQNISEAERSFQTKKLCANNRKRKKEYDRAQTLLNLAASNGATLQQMHKVEHKLKITLDFLALENLIEFRNMLRIEIS